MAAPRACLILFISTCCCLYALGQVVLECNFVVLGCWFNDNKSLILSWLDPIEPKRAFQSLLWTGKVK